MSENNIKLTISSDANGAVQQIKILGEAFLGAQKAAGATDTELKLMQAALQAAADEAAKAKAPTDALKDAVHALAMAQKEGAHATTLEQDADQTLVDAALLQEANARLKRIAPLISRMLVDRLFKTPVDRSEILKIWNEPWATVEAGEG